MDEPRRAPAGQDFPSRKCRLCGMVIYFIPGPKGRPIPAQRVRTAYVVSALRLTPVVAEGQLYVSHWETCPKADEFEKRRRRPT